MISFQFAFPLRRMLRVVLVLAVVVSMFLGGYPVGLAAESNETVRLVVELKEVAGDVEARQELRRAISEVRRISSRAPREYAAFGERRRAADLRRFRVVEVAQREAPQLLHDLQANPAVAEVHYERSYTATLLPNDPHLGDQYGLVSSSNPLADINAPEAWGKTTGSASTVIAIVDGGVDLSHEDLRDKLWVNVGEVANNGVDDDGNGFVDDVHGWDFSSDRPAAVPHNHGSHVAGIAAASSNNGVGIAGVDWGARIMSVRVLRSSGVGREEWIVRGIEYATAEGADIINLSLVGPPSSAIAAAIENAYASGVVVVAAAGNSRLDTGRSRPYPVCADVGGVDMVLGVGATDEDGEPASFSNYGDCVNISAPGKRIVSSVTGDRYRKMSGTSMSSPLAAGVAGLYVALHPGAGPAEVIAAVSTGDSFRGTRAAQWNERFKGKLNAARVVGAPFDATPPGGLPEPPGAGGPPADAGEAELSVALSAPQTVQPGSAVVYTALVANAGAAAAQQVVVSERFDRDLVFVPGSSSGTCGLAGRDVECRQDSLAAGVTATFTLAFEVTQDARCSSRFRERVSVYRDERGRSRRQDSSERVTTEVNCVE